LNCRPREEEQASTLSKSLLKLLHYLGFEKVLMAAGGVLADGEPLAAPVGDREVSYCPIWKGAGEQSI